MDRITLKVSLRGCPFHIKSKSFDGTTSIQLQSNDWNIPNFSSNQSIDIKLGFKTFKANGILLESSDGSGLYLQNSRLLWIQNHVRDRMEIGNFLDDNVLHVVHLTIDDSHINLKLDGFETFMVANKNGMH